jgi:hypothetical protein
VSRIPLGRLEKDTWAWSVEKYGMYTIRSGMVVFLKNNIACSSVSENNPLWQNVWKLKISPKVKVFWWRVINNYIHVHANLTKRHKVFVQTVQLKMILPPSRKTCNSSTVSRFSILTLTNYRKKKSMFMISNKYH